MLATALHVNLHVSWGHQFPHEWELDLIENTGREPGSGSHILKLLTDAADLHRREIVGLAQNMSNSRLPPDEWLLAWYEKHGFIHAVVPEAMAFASGDHDEMRERLPQSLPDLDEAALHIGKLDQAPLSSSQQVIQG